MFGLCKLPGFCVSVQQKYTVDVVWSPTPSVGLDFGSLVVSCSASQRFSPTIGFNMIPLAFGIFVGMADKGEISNTN